MSRLAVVVLNWNDPGATARCVGEVRSWDLPVSLRVVDNGSDDGQTEALAAVLEADELLYSPVNLGFGGGINHALARIEDAEVLLLNPDASLGRSDVTVLRETLAVEPETAVVGPLIRQLDDGGERLSAGGRDISRYVRTHRVTDGAETAADAAASVDYAPGTAVLLRREPTEAVGRFDERYFFGGEMADLCTRLRRAGWRSKVAFGATAVHRRAGRSRGRQARDSYYVLRNRFLYCRAHAPMRAARWAAYGLTSSVRHFVSGSPHLARAQIWALVDGLAGRYGDRHSRFAP